MFTKRKSCHLLYRTKNACVETIHSFKGPPPSSVYLANHLCDKWYIPWLSPLFLHTASNQKLDGGKAWERNYALAVYVVSIEQVKCFNWC